MRVVRLDAIQIMRLFAASLVVFDHTLVNLMFGGQMTENLSFAYRSGGFGVYVFFVISGFVMAHSMYDKFGADGVTASFMKRRLIRIVPLYWLITLAIAAKALIFTGETNPLHVFLSLSFIPYMADNGEVHPLNGVGWTLNYEMLFYLIFAFCLIASRRMGILLVNAILLLLVIASDFLVGLTNSEFARVAVKFWTDPILLYFLGGLWIGLGRLYLERNMRIPELTMPVAVSLLLAVILVYEVLLYFALMPVWLEALFVLLLVAGLAMFNCEAKGTVSRFMKLLGDGSYSIYLVHLPVVIVVYRICVQFLSLENPIAVVVLALVASSFAGLVSYKLIEKPMLNFFQRGARPGQPAVQRV